MANRGSASKRFSKLIRYFNFQQRTVVDPVTQQETIEEIPVLESVSLEASTDVTVSGKQVVTTANNSISTGSITIDTAEVTYNHSDSSLHVNGNALAFKSDIGNVEGDLTVSGGDITLGGTGRIQGIDTVSASTDAANKTYVDAAVGNNAFPSGTKMLFQQTSAPTGWTKDTTHNNKALRVVSGTAASGGTHAFTTVFDKTGTNNHTLTTSQIPSHNHSLSTNGNHNHSQAMYSYASHTSGRFGVGHQDFPRGSATVSAAGDHSHTVGNNGSGGAHSHGMDIRVQYVDVIFAAKD